MKCVSICYNVDLFKFYKFDEVWKYLGSPQNCSSVTRCGFGAKASISLYLYIWAST